MRLYPVIAWPLLCAVGAVANSPLEGRLNCFVTMPGQQGPGLAGLLSGLVHPAGFLIKNDTKTTAVSACRDSCRIPLTALTLEWS